jgi:hypothetical protein
VVLLWLPYEHYIHGIAWEHANTPAAGNPYDCENQVPLSGTHSLGVFFQYSAALTQLVKPSPSFLGGLYDFYMIVNIQLLNTVFED